MDGKTDQKDENNLSNNEFSAMEPGQAFSPSSSTPKPVQPVQPEKPDTGDFLSQGQSSKVTDTQAPTDSRAASAIDPTLAKQAGFMETPPKSTPSVFTPKKKSKKKLIAILVATLLLLGGGGAYAYVWTQENKPENVIATAIINLAMSDQHDIKSKIDYDVEGSKFKIAADFKSIASQKVAEGKISISTDKFSLGALEIKDVSVEVNGLIANDKAYVKISDFTAAVEQLFAPIESQLQGAPAEETEFITTLKTALTDLSKSASSKWIVIDQSETTVKDTVPASCDLSSVQNLSKDDQNKLKDSYRKNTFIVIKEKKGKEDVAGVNAERYSVGIDAAKLNAFGKDTEQLEFAKKIEQCNKDIATKIDGDKAPVEATDFKQEELDMTIDVWLDKKNKRLVKFEAPVEQDKKKVGNLAIEFGYQAQITTPEPQDAVTLEKFMEGLGDDLQDSEAIQSLISLLVFSAIAEDQ